MEATFQQHRARTVEDIVSWLREHVGHLQDKEPSTIAPDKTFNELGLDSSCAVEMIGELEEFMGYELDVTLPYDYPTIGELAGELARGASELS